MSLTLRNVKGSPLTFGEMDGNLTYLEGLAHSIPSTAKLYFLDAQQLVNDIQEVIENSPAPSDPIWATFTTNRLINVEDFFPIGQVLVGGFYNEYLNIDNNDLRIGYSGLINVGTPVAFASTYNLRADWNDGDVDGDVELTLGGIASLYYRWREDVIPDEVPQRVYEVWVNYSNPTYEGDPAEPGSLVFKAQIDKATGEMLTYSLDRFEPSIVYP